MLNLPTTAPYLPFNMKDLSHYRRSYERGQLDEAALPDDPIEFFKHWFEQAEAESPSHEANAMTLATTGVDGFPKSRIVLLKGFSGQGFTFFTNYNSDKGKAIENDPRVCLSFFWPVLERQVVIKGTAVKTSTAVSDEYFSTRPRGSMLGALASAQSSVTTREELLQKLSSLENEFEGKEIPRPMHWGGYTVAPVEIEFWQGRANRLHDRIVYKYADGLWTFNRLAP